jgi:hypothetical protein
MAKHLLIQTELRFTSLSCTGEDFLCIEIQTPPGRPIYTRVDAQMNSRIGWKINVKNLPGSSE